MRTRYLTIPRGRFSTAAILMILAPILMIGCANSHQGDQPMGDARPGHAAMVSALIEQFKVHVREGDAEGLADHFAEDGVRVVSTQRFPAVGREAVRATFKLGTGDGGVLDSTTLTATIDRVQSITDDIAIANGTFQVSDDSGVIRKGKWGNVFRFKDGRARLILESAHAEFLPDDDRSHFAITPRPMQARTMQIGGTRWLAPFDRLVARYSKGFESGDAEMAAGVFTDDGVHMFSGSPKTFYGREQLVSHFGTESQVDGPYKDARLRVKVLGSRPLTDKIVIMWGLFEHTTPSGKVVDFGQWGNVMEMQPNGEMKMIMESAGAYVGPNTPGKN